MKIYDFTVRKKYYERVVFALTLDKKRLTERIVIGETGQVRRSLEHGDGDVYYDAIFGNYSVAFVTAPQKD